MLSFVNINGERVSINPAYRESGKKAGGKKTETHKGWKVVGVPPEAMEQAKKLHKTNGKGLFDAEGWLKRADQKAIGKPRATPDGAAELAELSRKYGWLRVEIIELKKLQQGNP